MTTAYTLGSRLRLSESGNANGCPRDAAKPRLQTADVVFNVRNVPESESRELFIVSLAESAERDQT